MDQIMTWILKLIGYWFDHEEVHHRSRKLIESCWLILLKHIHMFEDYGFQNQMDYISIHQLVRYWTWTHCLSIRKWDFTLSLSLCLLLMSLYGFPKSVFLVMMLFVFLVWICRSVSFFSNLSTLSSTLNLYL